MVLGAKHEAEGLEIHRKCVRDDVAETAEPDRLVERGLAAQWQLDREP